MSEIGRRRTVTRSRMNSIKESLEEAATLAKGKTCVYATGSFGRGEAGKFSDLVTHVVDFGGNM